MQGKHKVTLMMMMMMMDRAGVMMMVMKVVMVMVVLMLKTTMMMMMMMMDSAGVMGDHLAAGPSGKLLRGRNSPFSLSRFFSNFPPFPNFCGDFRDIFCSQLIFS